MVVKTRDHRLSRKLSIPEFVLAFSLYRDVICSVTPLRREELDLYLYTVVELGHKYGGPIFMIITGLFPLKLRPVLRNFRW